MQALLTPVPLWQMSQDRKSKQRGGAHATQIRFLANPARRWPRISSDHWKLVWFSFPSINLLIVFTVYLLVMAHPTLKSVAASSAPSVLLSPEQPSDRTTMSGQLSDDVLRGVNLAFFAFAMLPIGLMTSISFYRVPRGKDPARIAFTYLKVMLPLTFL